MNHRTFCNDISLGTDPLTGEDFQEGHYCRRPEIVSVFNNLVFDDQTEDDIVFLTQIGDAIDPGTGKALKADNYFANPRARRVVREIVAKLAVCAQEPSIQNVAVTIPAVKTAAPVTATPASFQAAPAAQANAAAAPARKKSQTLAELLTTIKDIARRNGVSLAGFQPAADNNNGKPFSRAEHRKFIEHHNNDGELEQIALMVGRTVQAVNTHYANLGVGIRAYQDVKIPVPLIDDFLDEVERGERIGRSKIAAIRNAKTGEKTNNIINNEIKRLTRAYLDNLKSSAAAKAALSAPKAVIPAAQVASRAPKVAPADMTK